MIKKILSSILISTIFIQVSYWFNEKYIYWKYDYHLPWYFWNNKDIHAYEWIDDDLIKQIRVSLNYLPTSWIANFWKPEKTFEAEYIRILNLVKNKNNDIIPDMREIANKIINDTVTKDLFINYGPAFLQREHGWNKEQNPRNRQWCYQIKAIEDLYNSCWDTYYNWRRSLFKCNIVKKIYESWYFLTPTEQDMQRLDFMWYIYESYGWKKMVSKLLAGFDEEYSLKSNIKIWLNAVTNKSLSNEELEKYSTAIVNRQSALLIELISKYSKELSIVWINEFEDFNKWLTYWKIAFFGSRYNWMKNNYWFLMNKKAYNLLDHAYVSNYPQYDITFHNIKCDGCWVDWTRKDKNLWLIPIYLEMQDNWKMLWAEFAALLTFLKQNWDIPMTWK